MSIGNVFDIILLLLLLLCVCAFIRRRRCKIVQQYSAGSAVIVRRAHIICIPGTHTTSIYYYIICTVDLNVCNIDTLFRNV